MWSFNSIAVFVVNLLGGGGGGHALEGKKRRKFIELRERFKDLWLYLMHTKWIRLPAVNISTVFERKIYNKRVN